MTERLRSGVVVSNPGDLPYITAIAERLVRAGVVRTYCSSAGGPRILRFMRFVGRRLATEFRRRELAPAFGETSVENPALLAELLFVGLRRARLPGQVHALRLRNALFDRAVAALLRPENAAVVCYSTSATATLRRARALSVPSLLVSPIAHHRFAERLLGEEARLVPKFATSLNYHRFPEWRARQLDSEVEAADAVVVLSSFHRETFIQEGVDPRRIEVVHLGVDLDLFRPRPRRDDGVFRVIFSGQVTQRKGLSYLLAAFALAGLESSELLLVGGLVGNARALIDRPNVRHIPHVPRWELPDLYASADVFAFPSLLEGCPQTPLEAMASGLPVVVSRNAYGDDVVRDGVDGFVVPIRDPAAIAERLRLLHDDPHLRQRMGASARCRAEAFSWGRAGDAMLAAIRRVAGDSDADIRQSATADMNLMQTTAGL